MAAERITIRPVALADAEAIQQYASDPQIAATSRVPHPYPRDGSIAFVTEAMRAWEQGRVTPLPFSTTATLWASSAWAGWMRQGTADLRYWVAVPFWGRGVATAAARLAVRYAFTELRLSELQADCLARNPASARVLAKCGFTLLGEFRHLGSPFMDERMLRFCLTREDWERGAN